MSEHLVVTLTVPLPDDIFKRAGKVAALAKAIESLTAEMNTCLPGEHTIVTETVKERKTRGPRAKKADPAASADAPFDKGNSVSAKRAVA